MLSLPKLNTEILVITRYFGTQYCDKNIVIIIRHFYQGFQLSQVLKLLTNYNVRSITFFKS